MEIFAITPIVFKGLVRTSCGGVHSNKTKLDFYSKFKYKSRMNKERILDTMDEEAYRELEAENKALEKRSQEAEGELTIIKGIGNTSPEMRELKERVVELDKSLAIALEVNDSHQRYNGKLQARVTELEEDNKRLSLQIEDKVDQLRKSGMM